MGVLGQAVVESSFVDQNMYILSVVKHILTGASIAWVEQPAKVLRFKKAAVWLDTVVNFYGFDKVNS